MADRGMSKQNAYQFISKEGPHYAKTPGGNQAMGFRDIGPREHSIASKAQSYQGDVQKGSTFSGLQRGAMKKH